MTKESREKTESEIEKLKVEEETIRNEINSEGDWFSWKKFTACVLVVVIAWVLGCVPLFFFNDITKAGTFGDLFGAVNALFSGLAFAFVILALFAQRYDLKQQRRELRLSLIESQRSRIEYEKMSDAQEDAARWQFIAAYLSSINSQIEAYKYMEEKELDSGVSAVDWRAYSFPLLLRGAELLQNLHTESRGFVIPDYRVSVERLARFYNGMMKTVESIEPNLVLDAYRAKIDMVDQLFHLAIPCWKSLISSDERMLSAKVLDYFVKTFGETGSMLSTAKSSLEKRENEQTFLQHKDQLAELLREDTLFVNRIKEEYVTHDDYTELAMF